MKKSSKTNWPAARSTKSVGWINMNEVSGFLLYSAYFAWKRKIESTLLPHDLTHVQFMLLMTLGFLKKDGADVSQNDLAKFLSFDVTMTSQVLRALEKRGLLKRSQKEGDERSKFSELTDAGVSKIQGAAKDLLAAEESFFVSLGENKPGFDEHLRGILQQQIADAA
ncbi:MAG: MarR family transcriptional regulator [Acinetobacter sp.]|uniref:MarR family winged helix-turn-helix transcriptional regulator n=1 Tax=Acinetobacter sp. TaxID=472 RepID=UPI000FB7185A|nr:MarR family transcriptional regulator [Acinetobacter sp.]RUP38072.1 MAG: MarR family transcriptional regulator [Acinetobacter sp.]